MTKISRGFYRSSLQQRQWKNWSPISEEVWNFDKFALNTANLTYDLELRIVQGIWVQFDLILAKPLPHQIDATNQDYANWVNAAITAPGVSLRPAGFGPTAADILNAFVKQECNAISADKVPIHSGPLETPLTISSVMVGEKVLGKGTPRDMFTQMME